MGIDDNRGPIVVRGQGTVRDVLIHLTLGVRKLCQ